jgi:endonuclease/exonuclease/phosphatase family metal-dependent hydrolase
MSVEMLRQVNAPPFIDRNIERDCGVENQPTQSLVQRVFLVSLPFLALYAPLGRLTNIGLDGKRAYSSLIQCWHAPSTQQMAKTALSVLALASTVFLHPIGLLMTTLQDLGIDCYQMFVLLANGQMEEALCWGITNLQHIAYVSTMFTFSIEMLACLMILQVAIEIIRSRKELLTTGRYLETCAHILMALIRARQAVPIVAKTAVQWHLPLGTACVALSESVARTEKAVTNVITPDFSGWDRKLLRLSSLMTEPFLIVHNALRYRIVAPLDPSKFENCSSRVREVAVRCFIGFGAISGLAVCALFPAPVLSGIFTWGCGSKMFRAAGLALQKDGHTHVQGLALEKNSGKETKVLTWNVCGAGGGIPIDHGGVVNWKHRFEAICSKIDAEDADVVCLQEVYDESLWHALVERYQNKYAHFFGEFHASIWNNPLAAILGSQSGGMIFTKCAYHQFSVTSFSNNDWTLNSAFAALELKNGFRVMGTHLIYNNEKLRVEQLEQIVRSAEKKPMPTVLVGDLNIPRDGDGADTESLREKFDFSHQDKNGFTKNLSGALKEPVETCTNKLIEQWNEKYKHDGEYIDYIAKLRNRDFANIQIEDCSLVPAFDEKYDTKTALSDHHGIVATVRS